MTPTERILDALRVHGIHCKPFGKGWSCRCPAHDDRNPSLSVSSGDDGRALVHCHTGCATQDIVSALGLTMRDLMPDGFDTSRRHKKERRSNGTTYDTAEEAISSYERTLGPHAQRWVYHDGEGEPVCVIVRWDTHDGKTIRPISRHADRSGWIAGGLGGGARPLYRLPELNDTDPGDRVYVCEGEKAADALALCGLVATTSMHGAKSPSKTDWTPLRDRDVVILPDHDEQGERYAKEVARLALDAGARRVRIVRLQDHWPDLPAKGDIVDVLELEGGDSQAVRDAMVGAIEALVEGTAETATEPEEGAPILVTLSDVEAEEVPWLWASRVPLGRLTVIAGRQGSGKSMLTCDMAARVSRGAPWADGSESGIGSVIMVATEDGIADTIRPRLDAHDADTNRVHALQGVFARDRNGRHYEELFSIENLGPLEQALRTHPDTRLVIIDPIGSHIGGETDTNSDSKVRSVLSPLSQLASRYGTAVVVVAHTRKSPAGTADDTVLGSRAFTALARSVLHVMHDDVDERVRLLLPGKNNLSAPPEGLSFTIEGEPAKIAWQPGTVTKTADELMRIQSFGRPERTERDDAQEWLLEYLADGPKAATDVAKDAEAAGYSESTLRRAKSEAKIKSVRSSYKGGWAWALPEHAQGGHVEPKTVTCQNVAALGRG